MTQALYRGLDAQDLDRGYNLRARVPEHPAIFQRWADDSRAARDRLGGRLDLPYGPGERQRIDLFAPVQAGVPVLAFIHGGYWQALSRQDFSYLAPAFVARGIAFAAIGYDLCPTVTLDRIVEETAEALGWLHRQAGDLGLDPARLHVAGHSAGGHLTAMMAVTDWAARGLPVDLVKSGTAVSGVFDLEPIRHTYLNKALCLDEQAARRLSPLHAIPDQGPPLILAVGGDETSEFLRQQAEFYAAWTARGLEARTVDLPGLHHFDAVDRMGDPDSALFRATVAMIEGG